MRPIAVLVSHRPELFDRARQAAESQCETVAILHQSGTFADAVNEALAEVRARGGFAVKWDDHDTYPSDHVSQMARLWRPGALVYGMVKAPWGWAHSLCASAFDPVDVWPDDLGRVTNSLLRLDVVKTSTGVVKEWCQCGGSWGVRCPVHNRRGS